MSDDADLAPVTFATFYAELQKRSVPPTNERLIGSWAEEERGTVEGALREAVEASGVIGSRIPDFARDANGRTRTNQSKGNQAAAHLEKALSGTLKFVKAARKGYPDAFIEVGGVVYCLEYKATSQWTTTGSLRTVLTSSADRLIAGIKIGILDQAPRHLIATVSYDDASAVVETVRFDFLEPTSRVAIRLEASTSHKFLASGEHHSIELVAP